MAKTKGTKRFSNVSEWDDLPSGVDSFYRQQKPREVPANKNKTRYSSYSNSQLCGLTENKNLYSMNESELRDLNLELDIRLKKERIFL